MTTDEHRPRSPTAPLERYGMLSVALTLFAFNLWRYGAYLLDDTFISFRYAQNLVAGNGLVFNVGERVEGYTNFLFVLLSAGCLWLNVDPIIGTKALSLASALLLVLTVVRFENHGAAQKSSPSLALTLLLPLPAFAYWAVASFETMLFTSLLIVAVWLLQREHDTGRFRGAAIVLALLALTRPEGVFFFAITTAVFAFIALRQRHPFARRLATNIVVFSLVYGAYFAWRYGYYGDVLPNTFRAKVTGGWEQATTGLLYAGRWALAYPVLAGSVLLPLAYLRRRGREAIAADATTIALYAVALSYAVYVVLVGGDFMPFHRFFIPLLPLCAMLLARSIDAISTSRRRAAIVVIIAVHVMCGYLTEEPYRAFVAHRTAVVGRGVGEKLARQLAPNDLIAVNTAGAVPYYSARPAIDMLGLTDPAIAQRPVFIVSPGWAGHRRGWGAYVLERRPRVIFFYNSTGSREPFYLSDHELADNPYFRFFYTPRMFTLAAPAATQLAVAHFLAFPFGFDASGRAPWRDLGLEMQFAHTPVAHTVLYEGPAVAHYFELEPRDAALWDLQHDGTVDTFLKAVVARWRSSGSAAGDPAARERVDALCAAAYAKIQARDTAGAKTLLTLAAQQNDRARSPLVYQYIANVAVLDGDLFTAVAAQKEALRLAPDNVLYQRNLRSVLQVPYENRSTLQGGPPESAPQQ